MTLEQEVKNRNEYHKICIKQIDQILPYVQSMVGQRIYIQSGWSKKWNPPIVGCVYINENKPANRVNRWFEVSYNSLFVNIKTSFNNPDQSGCHTCEYYSDRFEVGKMDDQGKLVSVNERDYIHRYKKLNDEIIYEEEKAKFELLKELEQKMDDIRSSIKVDRCKHYSGLGLAYKR